MGFTAGRTATCVYKILYIYIYIRLFFRNKKGDHLGFVGEILVKLAQKSKMQNHLETLSDT